jgi:DNA (cytosine-5)-methyltransferase 1
LFESESLRGNPAPSRKKREDIAGTITTGFGSRGVDADQIADGGYVIMAHGQANAEVRNDEISPSLTCNHEAPIIVHGTQDPCYGEIAFALGRNNGQENVLTYGIPGNWIGRKPENGGNATAPMIGIAPCLTGTDKHALNIGTTVRRLTPVECERLQGLPDNWTQIPWKGKPKDQCPDGPRYKAIGNSMAVPVMKWIGERINE